MLYPYKKQLKLKLYALFYGAWEDQIFWSEHYEGPSGHLAIWRHFAIELLSKPLLHDAGKVDRAQVQGRLVSRV